MMSFLYHLGPTKLFALMLLGHFVADFTLQGILAEMKQRDWWASVAPQRLYRYDYLMGLLCHSLYWSLIVMLPLLPRAGFESAVLANTLAHAAIDHAKANVRCINLWTDQFLHVVQILLKLYAMEVLP